MRKAWKSDENMTKIALEFKQNNFYRFNIISSDIIKHIFGYFSEDMYIITQPNKYDGILLWNW